MPTFDVQTPNGAVSMNREQMEAFEALQAQLAEQRAARRTARAQAAKQAIVRGSAVVSVLFGGIMAVSTVLDARAGGLSVTLALSALWSAATLVSGLTLMRQHNLISIEIQRPKSEA